MGWDTAKFEDMIGKTITSISQEEIGDNNLMSFLMSDGTKFRMIHFQDCCEQVSIDDIVGDLDDLIGSPLTLCEEVTKEKEGDDYEMWTFYKLATVKGYVDIKWFGSSNGYYSVSVCFEKSDGEDDERTG